MQRLVFHLPQLHGRLTAVSLAPLVTNTGANPQDGDVFLPGTVRLSTLEAYSRCYANPDIFGSHFDKIGRNMCSVSQLSPDRSLIYYMIEKSASSTTRKFMSDSFRVKEQWCPVKVKEGTNQSQYEKHFTVVREPSSRFVSQYQETMLRVSLHNRTIPAQYSKFLDVANLTAINHLYWDLYGSEKGASLAVQMMNQFVNDYDNELPFDIHLRLQIPHLVDPKTGRTRPLDKLLELNENLPDALQRLSRGDSRDLEQSQVGNHRPGRNKDVLNLEALSSTARQKICKLNSLDYCCLNFELPEDCREEQTVRCRWVSKPSLSDELLIEPVW